MSETPNSIDKPGTTKAQSLRELREVQRDIESFGEDSEVTLYIEWKGQANGDE